MQSFVHCTVLCCSANSGHKKKLRRPAGYWKCDSNLKREIERYNNLAGVELDRMPTRQELCSAKRRDLDNAISKAGGYVAVRNRLSLISQTKRPRKPSGFWKSFSNVESEVRQFMDDRDLERMPTLNELRDAGRGDLGEVILRHGGFQSVAERMKLNTVSMKKAAGYWSWENVESELTAFMEQQCCSNSGLMKMPTQKELRDAGRGDLEAAISKKGGFRTVARLLGVVRPKRIGSRFNSFWKVARDVYELADASFGGRMPTSADLRAVKRPDLIDAIRRFGGMADVARRLGLAYRLTTRNSLKDFDVFEKEFRRFCENYGESGLMPSARMLSNFGRDDLHSAVLHHGGETVVALRLELKRGYLSDFSKVAQQVLEFVEKNGVDGIMPTERDLLDLQRNALNVAVAKFGYERTAERLGLRIVGQSSNRAIEAYVSNLLADEEDNCSLDDTSQTWISK